jgi:hypothetical protein
MLLICISGFEKYSTYILKWVIYFRVKFIMHSAITNELGTIIFFEKTVFPTDGLLVSTETNLQKLMFRVVFWDILPCKMIVDRHFRGAYCLHHQKLSTVENNLVLFFKNQW